jgi:glutathione S-transferase
MMKLYGIGPARQVRPLWVLQELGLDFESVLVDVPNGEHRSPQFLKLNPAGKIPVLLDAFPASREYTERMYARPHAPPRMAKAFETLHARR